MNPEKAELKRSECRKTHHKDVLQYCGIKTVKY
jgi:hypothetical protein